MTNDFFISYVTTLPKEANSPKVKIVGQKDELYLVEFYEKIGDSYVLVSHGNCNNNQTIVSRVKQWFTNWYIKILDSNKNIKFVDVFDLRNKFVFIKFDAYALGDTIAWIPYVEHFRKKHNCYVICSTFHNDILVKSYPNIMFVKPNTVIDNIYAQYYVGASNDENLMYSPIKVNQNPLQYVASSILGLPNEELITDLTEEVKHTKPTIPGKYVTLSEFGSFSGKEWKCENGWQKIVDYINDLGYKVVVISKEKTNLENVINKTGDYPIRDRMIDIYHSKYHLGVSSGLSWLSWSLNKHTILISDVTPTWHEFKTNVTRISSNELSEVDYNVGIHSTYEFVLNKIKNIL